MLAELPTDMNGSARTPAAGHLFDIKPEAKNCPSNCPNISSPSNQLTLPIKIYLTRHTNGSSIPMYQGTSP